MSASPDGADPELYLYLRDVDRAGLMWEFLRRDPNYIGWFVRASRITRGDPPVPKRWGLLLAENPALPAPEARILWRAELDPGTLRVRAQPARIRDRESLPLQRLRHWLSRTRGADGREHAVFSNGLHHLRLDIERGTLGDGPVLLHYYLPSLARWQDGLVAVRRLMALCAERQFPAALFPPEPHPDRWIELLRTSDALLHGASQREVAELLFGVERAKSEWHGRSDSMRSRIRRLVRQVRLLGGGGYRTLMREEAASGTLRAMRAAKNSPPCLFRAGD